MEGKREGDNVRSKTKFILRIEIQKETDRGDI